MLGGARPHRVTPAKELMTDETLLAQSAMLAFWSATASASGRINLAQNEGLETASACPGFMPSCLRPLLCKGNVPFCRAPSRMTGKHLKDRHCDKNLFSTLPRLHRGLDMTQERIALQGYAGSVSATATGPN